MSDFNLLKLPEMPKFLDEGLTPAAKEIGTTLSNIFYMVFSPINYPVQQLRIKQAQSLRKYEQDIQNELNKVPEDNLIEPSLSIVGPALDASKFYIEEDEIRKMFAKLIASSMNKSCTPNIHHCFTEIIKQLSSLDAINLRLIYSSHIDKDPEFSLFVLYFARDAFSSNDYGDGHQQMTSIDNLVRLGLLKRYLKDLKIELITDYPHPSYCYNDPGPIQNLKIEEDDEREVVVITNLGIDFCTVCLS